METLFGQFALEISDVILTFLGVLTVAYTASFLKGKIKRVQADRAVRFVEQAFSDIKGTDKYNEAAKWIVDRLAKWHIQVNEDEVKGLVESALVRMKQEYEKQW